MEQPQDAGSEKLQKYRFKNRSKEENNDILKGKDKLSTQRATEDLDLILFDFYSSILLQKKDDYSVQTLKCIRAGLNRHFRTTRGIDITKDATSVKASKMFKAIQVDAKKKQLAVKRSYPPLHKLIWNTLLSISVMIMSLCQTPKGSNR